MPPTLNAFALVWPDLHLSLVNFSLVLPLAELDEDGLLELLSLAFDELSDAAGGEGKTEDGGAGHHSRPCSGGGSIHGVNLSVAWVLIGAPPEKAGPSPCHRRTGAGRPSRTPVVSEPLRHRKTAVSWTSSGSDDQRGQQVGHGISRMRSRRSATPTSSSRRGGQRGQVRSRQHVPSRLPRRSGCPGRR